MTGKGRRLLKNIAGKVHLWLGLSTGLVVFVVALTGCIYCFQEEIRSLYDDYKAVEAQSGAFIPPTRAYEIAQGVLPGRHIHSVVYGDKTDALEVVFYEADPDFYQMVYLNPYSGKLIKVVDMESDFFHFIIDGHMYLWMGDFGKQVVAYSTLIFLFILISGLVLWWPRNRKAAKKRVRFRWVSRTKWKRKNYDLHNVLGFYASAVALILAVTGLVMALNWFGDGFYRITGGEKKPRFSWPENISRMDAQESTVHPVDEIWRRMMQEYPGASEVEMHFPPDDGYAVYAYMKYSEGTYWDSDYRYFDSRTLREIEPDHVYGKIDEASIPDTIRRMNYDIHVGAIGGLPGKIIVFLSSMIVGSLPLTGVTIWWGRRKIKGVNGKKSGARGLQVGPKQCLPGSSKR